MIFNYNWVVMDEVSGDGSDGGGGADQSSQQAQQSQQSQSPNDGWQNDDRLDENGNPKQDTQDTSTNKADSTQQSDSDQSTEETTEQREYDLSSPVVQQVEKLLKEAGLDVSDVAKDVNSNDGKPSPELMKALVDKHGEAVASIVAEQLQGFHTSRKAADTKRNQVVFDQVQSAFEGTTEQTGQETWNELAGWAKDNVPADERKEINQMLSQGGLAAKYAVDDLVSRFKSSEAFVQPAELIAGDNTSNDFGVKPLSKTEYSMKLRELEAKGHVYGQSQEMAALDKRRMAGMQRGI